MPNLNGMGPEGNGSMTGRKQGACKKNNQTTETLTRNHRNNKGNRLNCNRNSIRGKNQHTMDQNINSALLEELEILKDKVNQLENKTHGA